MEDKFCWMLSLLLDLLLAGDGGGKLGTEKGGGGGVGGRHLLGSARGDDTAAVAPSVGPHVDNEIG